MTDSELIESMKDYKNFLGAYTINEIKNIKIPKNRPFGVALFLPFKNEPYEGHWTGLYIDPYKDLSVEYYDSYAEETPKELLKILKKIISKINPSTFLKFKYNRIKNQRANSDSCGFFVVEWLKKRLNGVSWKDASGYSTILKSERNIRKYKDKFIKYGYI